VISFVDRRDAGRRLGTRLVGMLGAQDAIVVGLARGGVPVAFEVADVLKCPLDVLVVRKVGLPQQPELAMGAVGENGVFVEEVLTVDRFGVSREQLDRVVATERAELDRRIRLYREGRKAVNLEGQSVIIVDDGLATGATAEAACQVVRAHGASRVTVAVPVTSVAAAQRIESIADQLVTLVSAAGPFAVGAWYEHFGQTSDQEVIDDLVRASTAESANSSSESDPIGDSRD
jgi:putative phosphoribosyl transferase